MRLLGFLLFLFLLIPLICIDDVVVANAAHACPDGTFLSGRVHEWNGWTFAFFGVAIWMFAGQAIGRLWKKPDIKNDQFFSVWGKIGTTFLIACVLITAAFYWIGSSSQFCLAKHGIYSRDLPWQGFKQRSWSDVKRITVNCSNGYRAPDLYYELTFGDGAILDVADAFPNPKAYPQFQTQLANVPFSFHADIQPSCPDWFSDWVGRRP